MMVSEPTVSADASSTVSAPMPVALPMMPMALPVLVSDLLPAPTKARP